MPLMTRNISLGAVIALTCLSGFQAHADNQSQILEEISGTADRLCGYVAEAGQTSSTQVTGQVTAQLSGLAKRLADLGVNGAGTISDSHFEGVLQSQLAQALNDLRSCKLHVFDILTDRLIPKPASPNRRAPPQSPQPVQSPPHADSQPSNSGPVAWNLNLQFLVVTGGGPQATINSIILQGISQKSLTFKKAFALSGLTGHKQDLMANVGYKGYYPVDQVDIPPDAPVVLELVFPRPGLSIRAFLDQWGKLAVTIVYDDGTIYEHDFDSQYVLAKLHNMAPDAFGPHVTVRSDAGTK